MKFDVHVPAAGFADYRERSIDLNIPAGTGGVINTSVLGSAILLEEKLGTSITVLNVGVGGGSEGASQFMQAKLDGYSLFAMWNSPPTTVYLISAMCSNSRSVAVTQVEVIST